MAVAYLAAALAPCGIPEDVRSASHSAPISATITTAPAHSNTKDAEDATAANTAAPHAHTHVHAHGGDHASSEGPVASSGSAISADPSSEASELSAAVSSARAGSGLVFKAPCLCGCEETRGNVGGGAARLGAVVPGTSFARLIELEPPAIPAGRLLRFVETTLPADPWPV